MDVRPPVATLRKRGPAWFLDWREDGERFRRSLGKITRKEAQAIQAEKDAELHGIIEPRSGLSCAALIADYLAWYEKARPTTYKRAVSALRPFVERFGQQAAEGIDPRKIEMWEVGREARAAANKAVVLAKAAYRGAMRTGSIRINPLDRVKASMPPVSRAPSYYKPPELHALYGAARGPLWAFMANTGIRRGEMAKAHRGDVRDGLLYVESIPSGRTKSGKWRAIPLNAAALGALDALGDDRLVECETADTLTKWFGEDAATTGVHGTLHWLRHTFCTALVQSGVSLHTVKDLAGHSSITVTEKYAHHAPQQGRRAVDFLDAWAQHGRSEKPKRRVSG